MADMIEAISNLITTNSIIAPILAVVAGVLTSFTPCSLSTVPLVVGYVGASGSNNTKNAFGLSLTFAVGSGITFTILGVIAATAGSLLGNSSSIWYLILGILMMLMALQTFEIYEIIPSSYLISKNKKRGYIGALLAGMLGGVFSSPCSTPVLIALLAVVASSENIAYSIMLLLLYSIGHGVLAVIAGSSVGFVSKLSKSEKFGKFGRVLKIVMGIAIMLIGFYMFYLAF